METLGRALVVILLAVLIGYAIGTLASIIARYVTRRILNTTMMRRELPPPDPFLQGLPVTRNTIPGTPRDIVMVAPFGLCIKMTTRSRIIPMALALFDSGHNVTILIPSWDCVLQRMPIEASDALRITMYYPWGPFPRTMNPILAIRIMLEVRRLKPDILYCFKPIGYSGLTALLFTLRLRVRHYLRLADNLKIVIDTDDLEGRNGWAERRGFISQRIINFQEKLTIRHTPYVTAVSRYLADYAERLRGRPANIIYLPNGVRRGTWTEYQSRISPEVMRARELAGEHCILLYTRFAEFSADRVAAILNGVLSEFPSTSLLLLGNSFDSDSRHQKLLLFDHLRQLGIADEHVIVKPWVPFEELADYWRLAQVAMYPLDDSPLVRAKSAVKMLELMSIGMPIVADGIGEAAEIIEDGVSGLLAAPHNNIDFSNKLTEIMGDSNLRESLSKGAREVVSQRYTWNRLRHRLDGILEPTEPE